MIDEVISQRTVTFLLVSIGLITFPHLFHVPLPIISFFFILLLWRFLSISRPYLLPNKIIVFLLLLSGVGLLALMHQGVFGRDAGTAVFVVALGLKLLEIKSQRDLYLIIFLAFIVAASQFLYVQNILMAGYILLVSVSLLAGLVSINVCVLNTRQTLKIASKILVQALPLMVIIFIFFPRMTAPRWSFLEEKTNERLSGLSDTLEPGSISQLGLSSERVFRAKFTGKIPSPEERYWRGPVFSKTDGKKWTQANRPHLRRYLDRVAYQGEAYQYNILMERQEKNWVFGLDLPALFQHPLIENGYHQLLSSSPPSQRAEYTITSYAHYNTGYITKTEMQDSLELPKEPIKRVKTLVLELGGFDMLPDIYIDHLYTYFQDEQFYYTLRPPLMGENPIEVFLFDVKAGFCGHFATAFVYLMRVAGIPARVVTGYQGGEYNETGGFIEVRQANAHAWAEVWIRGKGWVRYDPTTAVAPGRVEQDVNIEQQIANHAVSFFQTSETPSYLRGIRHLWSSADYSWHHWVINYDRKHQLSFLSGLGIDSLKMMLYWLVGLVCLVVFILAFSIFRQQRAALDEAQIYYLKACEKLRKLGLIRRENEGANDFSRRVSLEVPELEDSFTLMTKLYVKTRYGKQVNRKRLVQLKNYASTFKVPAL